jgi:serine protease
MVKPRDPCAFDTDAVRYPHVNRPAGLLAAALAIVPLWSVAAEYNGSFPQRAPASAAGDRVLVKWRATAEAKAAPDADGDRLAKLNSTSGLRLQRMRELAPRLELLRLEQAASGAELERILARLGQDPAVEYAVADQRRWPHLVPSDALFNAQWHLQSTQPAATRAELAWDMTTGSAGTVVAVLDTGVRFNHPDLGRAGAGGKLLPGFDFITDTTVANDGNGRDGDPSDPGDWIDSNDIQEPMFSDCILSPSSWHGTKVSGIIAAGSDNGIGVSGESWNTWILPVRVLGKCGGFDSDIITAMRWAAGLSVGGIVANPYPAQIINLSLGSPGACPASYADVVSELRARGVLVVASAGNEGSTVNVPANCPGVLAVAAVRHVGTKVGFSNLGPAIALSAPGGNCVNVDPGQPCLFSIDTTIDTGLSGPAGPAYSDQFNFNVGTSFSAPIVAGAAALMHSVNARLGPELLTARLEASTMPFPVPGTPPPGGTCHVPLGPTDIQTAECVCTTNTCGAGMLNSAAAVSEALRPIVAIALPASVTPGQTISLDGAVSAAACNRTLSIFAWSVAPTSPVSPPITGADQALASVQAPTSGNFVLRLTITDNTGAQDFADVTVTPTSASTTAFAPLSGNACPIPITVAPPPPGGGGGGGGNGGGGGGGGGELAVELLALALVALRRGRARFRAA